jgi:hypothetical protein
MARRTSHLLLFLFALLAAPLVARAQVDAAQDKHVRAQDKKRKEVKEVKKEEKRIAKQHLANQDKATRKRMKQHRRRADKQGNRGHRDPFLRRLFHSRH